MTTDTADRLGDALGDRYRVERQIGAGATATVYLARDLRHDRDVALKVLRSELAESLGRARFLREIRLAARLNHPPLLPLHDSGDAGGQLSVAQMHMSSPPPRSAEDVRILAERVATAISAVGTPT